MSVDSIVVFDADPRWPDEFIAERERILRALGERALAVEHYGSTAVPNLAAKPTLDVMVAIADLDDTAEEVRALEQAGYERRPGGDLETPRRLFLVRYESKRRIAHVALVEPDSDYWREHLAFRDALRADADLARRYAELKRDLAARHPDDRIAYTDGKTAFVETALAGRAPAQRSARKRRTDSSTDERSARSSSEA